MPTNDPQTYLQGYRDKVNKNLETIFNEVPGLLGFEISNYSHTALMMLREYSLRPGKRLRGVLTSFSYDEATDSIYGEAGLRAATAVELIQSYLLIIDDVMDKSSHRRGLPSLHKIYTQNNQADDDHLPNMKAISVGLIAQHLASIILETSEEKTENIKQAGLVFQRNIAATVLGQLDDLHHHADSGNISEDEILRMYGLKCGFYTFVNPLQVGLALGGISDKEILKEVEDFGQSAGIAFQLSDDLLGVFGSPASTGKSNLDDIKEGKYTLLIRQAFNNVSQEELDFIKKMLGNKSISESDFSKLKNLLEACGAKKYVKLQAERFATEAKKKLNSSEYWSLRAKDFMNSLVDYSVNREK